MEKSPTMVGHLLLDNILITEIFVIDRLLTRVVFPRYKIERCHKLKYKRKQQKQDQVSLGVLF